MGTSELSGIPSVIWSAVASFVAALIGGAMALGGVYLTNRGAERRLAQQLTHDSAERQRERHMALRREVYLDAVANISRVSQSLGRLANLADQDVGKDLAEAFAALGRIHVTGGNDAVHAVIAVTDVYAQGSDELIYDRLALQERQQRIDGNAELLGKAQAGMDRWLEEMKRVNIEGSTDKRLFEVLNRNFEFEQKRHALLLDQQQTLQAEQAKGTINLLRSASKTTSRAAKLIPPALFAIRSELGLPIDEDAYTKHFTESVRARERSTETLFNKLAPQPKPESLN